MQKLGSTFWITLMLALTLGAAASAGADDYDDWDAGEYCPMGRGMMGGGGMGMMGGGGMGMMGGGGMGMMGGGGMGMMGHGAVFGLDLSPEQREKINRITDEERKEHWSVMGKMMELQSRMRDLSAQERPDPKKVGEVYGQMAKLRQQMVETHVKARNDIDAVLTEEQRAKLRDARLRGGMGGRWGRR